MPWGKPHTFYCIDPGCGAAFTSTAINALRCEDHRQAHNLKRIKERYEENKAAKHDQLVPYRMDDIARLNLYISHNCHLTICPECGRHMTACRCCEPVVRHVEPVHVATFDPLALPVPAVCSDRDTWEPWK